MCDKSDWDRYKIRYESNLSNVLNPERIDITLARMIISQIQMFVERYLIHRLPKVGLESGVCAKYLRVLLDLEILRKENHLYHS